MRYFLFRIMIGAGLIKLKSGDSKWKYPNFSAMDYFYETQPVPNPLTRYFHFMPRKWHRFEVLTNHFIEMIVPFGMILPIGRNVKIYSGFLQILFQMVLITSGNLSFLNWLTMVSIFSIWIKKRKDLNMVFVNFSYQHYFVLMTLFYQNICRSSSTIAYQSRAKPHRSQLPILS